MSELSAQTRQPFDDPEFQRRIDLVQAAMAARGLDALIVSRPQNVYYLTGFRGADSAALAAGMGLIVAAVIPQNGGASLLVRSLETGLAEAYCWSGTSIIPYRDYENPYRNLKDRLPGARSIAGDYGSLTAAQLECIREALGIDILDAGSLVDEIRRIKSDAELSFVREASDIANSGMRVALDVAGSGVRRVRDIVSEVAKVMYDLGQDDFMCPPAYAFSGPQGGLMHDSSLDGIIEPHDVVTFGIMGVSHLYAAEALSSVYAGVPPPEMRSAYELAVELHDAARSSLQEGSSGEEVHSAVEAVNMLHGRGPYRRRVGGAIGINGPGFFFEGYSLVKGETEPLRAGMVVNIQPGVDAPAMLIVHSTALIGADGFEELVHPVRDLVAC